MSRRRMLKSAAAVAITGAVAAPRARAGAESAALYVVRNGRIKQSVVHWCFNPMSVADLAEPAAKMGCRSVELVAPEHWPMLRERGLVCAISSSHGFSKGFAHREEHEECLVSLRKSIDATSDAGWPSVITFSGFRRGLSDEAGMKNMVEGLKKIVGYAEKKKVTLCLEMLNSRVNVTMKGHPDYFCDDIDKTVEICRQISSERMKVLFDIYHVQIMHGDIMTRIRQHAAYVGHYHTAGVPGRGEIDAEAAQEINYPPLMKLIAETGYQGYVGQEFIPVRDKVTSLNKAIQLCDV